MWSWLVESLRWIVVGSAVAALLDLDGDDFRDGYRALSPLWSGWYTWEVIDA